MQQKWEYMWSKAAPEVMNELAKQGWEVLLVYEDGEKDLHPILMKRPLPAEPEPSEALTHENVSRVARLYYTAKAASEIFNADTSTPDEELRVFGELDRAIKAFEGKP